MSPGRETIAGFEITTHNPNDGENEAWIPGELYQSATPEQWDDKPITFFRRLGDNKLLVASDLYAESMLKELGSELVKSSNAQTTTLSPLDLHIRTDGLHLWSPLTSKGLCMPIESLATWGPERLAPSPISTSTSLSPSLSPSAHTEAFLIYIIPDTNTNAPDDDKDFSPSFTYRIIPAAHHSDALSVENGNDDGVANGADGGGDGSAASPIYRIMAKAINDCLSHLPPPPDEEPQPMLLNGVSVATAGLDLNGGGGGEGDVVRIPELEGFEGWVTAENLEEVMRGRNLSFADADGSGLNGLGPGAGSLRRREEGEDGDEDGDEDGERVTIWRRTED